jgi:recombination protein RecT
MAAAQQQKDNQHVIVRRQVREVENSLKLMNERLVSALPSTITIRQFTTTVLTACTIEPKLLACDRQSLFLACMKSARDGLLPDGREAALVPFNESQDDGPSKKVVTYIPMYGGLLKKVRNSGELASLSANAVYANDLFEYELGDNERILHRPSMTERGPIVAAYAIAKTKSGGIYRRVLNAEDAKLLKAFSKAKKGPWSGPFESEMWIKSAIRRLAKILPQSTDLNSYLANGPELPAAEAGSVLPDEVGEAGMQSVEFELRTRAMLALREGGADPDTLQGVWDGVRSEYQKIGVDVPVEVEDVYIMSKEALAPENQKQ